MFKLSQEPIAFQLTVHRCNYEMFRTENSFVTDFNECCHGSDYVRTYNPQMMNLISYYGIDTMQRFIEDFKLGHSA